MKNIAILGISLFAVGATAFWYGSLGGFGFTPVRQPPMAFVAASGSGAARIGLEPARADGRRDAYETFGIAQANEALVIAAQTSGTVRRVNFEDGSYVESDAILVELTSEEQAALLAEARASLGDAERQLRRLEYLERRRLSAESELEMARERLAAARAHLETVRVRLRDRVVSAPFSGLLSAPQVEPGARIAPATAIATLEDIDVIKVDFKLPEAYLRELRPGTGVSAWTASSRKRGFQGVVQTVNPRVDPVTRVFSVRAAISNDDGALRPGMPLTIRVVTERE